MSKRNLEDFCERENMNGLSSELSANGSVMTAAASEADLKKAKLDNNDSGSGLYHNENGNNGNNNGMQLNGSLNSSSLNGPSMHHHSGHGHGQGQGQPHHRQQLHNSNPPSRVVHIRGVPNDAQEGEIVTLGLSFGRISNVLILKGKNQAFLEMADEASAIHMVNYFNSGFPCMIKGRICYVQFSTHRELRTDQTHSNNSVLAQTALKASLPGVMAQTALGSPLGPQVLNDHGFGGMNTILRVVIENMMYPVSLDILNGIFSRYGKVLRIITFTKNQQFQALIQFPDRPSAASAKQHLDAQNIYTGCCTLRIEYSRMENLRVIYNNDKSRDYTNPTLPSGDAMDVLQQYNQAMNSAGMTSLLQSMNHSVGMGMNPASAYNASLLQASMNNSVNMPMGNLGRLGQLSSPSCVVLVSNINEEMVTPDVLFVLFGVFGDVLRVKILFNKKDTALIQFSESRQAQLATLHLDRVKLYGKQLKVSTSRHNEVQMPKDGQVESGLTKDYTNSPLHRFKKPGSKNYQNIYPPAPTLHLSNIPSNLTEEDMMRHFHDGGFNVKHFRFFPKDHKMALLQLGSVEEAVECLIKMHNFQLNENTHLRVSFSKTLIKD